MRTKKKHGIFEHTCVPEPATTSHLALTELQHLPLESLQLYMEPLVSNKSPPQRRNFANLILTRKRVLAGSEWVMSAGKGDVSVFTSAKFWTTITKLISKKKNSNTSVEIPAYESRRRKSGHKPLFERDDKTEDVRDKEGNRECWQSGQPRWKKHLNIWMWVYGRSLLEGTPDIRGLALFIGDTSPATPHHETDHDDVGWLQNILQWLLIIKRKDWLKNNNPFCTKRNYVPRSFG